MAEGILFNIVDQIIGRLGSQAVKEIGLVWGVKDELEDLKDTLSTIKAVLLDAEKQQINNNQVRDWLEKLEDAADDADNLLDEISTEALRRQLMSGNNMVKKVCTFFSASNQLVFRLKMAHRITGIMGKLNKIAANRNQFHFDVRLEETSLRISRGRETHSFVPEENVIGRDEDKVAVMRLLFDEKDQRGENVSVISIVGMGGLGKTTIAQLVFNDKRVKDHFDLKVWVCVSDAFDVRLPVEKIIKLAAKDIKLENPEMEQLQESIREKISGKRFLIVFDDVWNDNPQKWQELKDLLMHGAKGSKIMLTTRNVMVARAAGSATRIHHLGILDEDKSWDLFRRKAFEGGQEPSDSKIVKTGMAIVKKCKGVPLAIITIGSMLSLKNPEIDWPSFLEMEISKIPQEQDYDILPTLKLSYDHLPSHLKHCFAYCSLFPKDYEIHVPTLLYLWMAQGFIALSDQSRCLEDISYDYFQNLLSRSLFQEIKTSPWGTIERCKMHDLMHDLAVSVAGKKCATLMESKTEVDEKAIHVSLSYLGPQWQIPPSLVAAKKIRSFLIPTPAYFSPNLKLLTSKFKFLRTLDLSNLGIKEVSSSISKLKHLRSLDLSRNYRMRNLPNSICKLQNLQKLDLTDCLALEALPRDTSKLISLRSLEIGGCSSLTYMPRGLGDLANLQILSKFVVRNDSTGNIEGDVAELTKLLMLNNNLRGQLMIKNLRHGMEFKPEYFAEKRHLQSLELHWEGYGDELVAETLEGFQPPSNLKVLDLYGYGGAMFPDSLSDHLHSFTMTEGKNCLFPPQFHSLKKLELWSLLALEYIMDDTDPSRILPFLEHLDFANLPNLKGWWKNIFEYRQGIGKGLMPSFACLSYLYIEKCPKLSCMPLFPTLVEELTLTTTSLEPFKQTMTMKLQAINEASSSSASSSSSSSSFAPLSNLKNLTIWNIKDIVESLPDWMGISLSSLKQLTVGHCPNLKTLSPAIQHFTSLRELRIEGCPDLKTLFSSKIQGFSSLRELIIEDCEELEIYDTNMWQPLTGLTLLNIKSLPQLVDLPEGVKQLPSLQFVHVWRCSRFSRDQYGSITSGSRTFTVVESSVFNHQVPIPFFFK